MPSEEEFSDWLKATLPFCVSLWREQWLPGRADPRVLCGTSVLVRCPVSSDVVLVTAAHVVPTDDEGGRLPMYAGVADTLQVNSEPLFFSLCDDPDRGPDLAIYRGQDIMDAASGSKRAIALESWPPVAPKAGESALVVGFPCKRTEKLDVPMAQRARFDAYHGVVDRVARYTICARVTDDPPYPGAPPIGEAVGISGGPCFIIRDGTLRFAAVHRAAVAGPGFLEQVIDIKDLRVS